MGYDHSGFHNDWCTYRCSSFISALLMCFKNTPEMFLNKKYIFYFYFRWGADFTKRPLWYLQHNMVWGSWKLDVCSYCTSILHMLYAFIFIGPITKNFENCKFHWLTVYISGWVYISWLQGKCVYISGRCLHFGAFFISGLYTSHHKQTLENLWVGKFIPICQF